MVGGFRFGFGLALDMAIGWGGTCRLGGRQTPMLYTQGNESDERQFTSFVGRKGV